MSVAPLPPPVDRQVLEEAQMRIRQLFRRLGLGDPQGVEILIHDCLQRARLRAQDAEDLPRRAVEEAQRRYDLWLQRALELAPTLSAQELRRARAAVLYSALPGVADGLSPGKTFTGDEREALRAAFPQPLPHDAPVAMSPQALSFLSFTGRRKRDP